MKTPSKRPTLHLSRPISVEKVSRRFRVDDQKVKPKIRPWVRPENIQYMGHMDATDDDDVRIADRSQWVWRTERLTQLKVLYDGGPGKCTVAVADHPDGPAS